MANQYSAINCDNIYSIEVPCGDDIEIGEGLNLPASTSLEWLIIDKFNNHYEGSATTGVDQKFIIESTDLPDGLVVPSSGTFVLKLFDQGVQLTFEIDAIEYSSISINAYI